MFNPGFFGKNGLQPFIGQIPLGQIKNRVNPQGWADRYKVRIHGFHPADGTILPDDDLPWGIAVKPTSQGNANKGTVGFSGGETVFGLWDKDSQIIFILGSIARSNYEIQKNVNQQLVDKSLGFKLPQIFNSTNPAASWNYTSGNDGVPSGKKTPVQLTQGVFDKSVNLLG